jgi:hypothetical protein
VAKKYRGPGKRHKQKARAWHGKMMGLIFLLITLSFIASATETTTSTKANFDEGIYTVTEYNTSGFVQLAINDTSKELPHNGTNDGITNMTGNVLLMHMNEASGIIIDNSGLENNGTGVGDPTYGATGILNTAMSFEGGNEGINLSNTASINPSEMTVSAWVYLDGSDPSYGVILSRWNNGNAYFIGTLPNSAQVVIYFSGSLRYTTPALPIGEWVHLLVTNDGDGGTVSYYQNGAYVGGGASGGAISSSTSPSSIGYDVERANYPFKGDIDEFAIWNRTLSTVEISDIYNRTKNSYSTKGIYTSEIFNPGSNSQWNNISWNSTGIGELPDNNQIETFGANMTGNVLLLHLDESSGLLMDTSGNTNNGTNAGASYGASGKYGTAMSFDDGNDDRINFSVGTLNSPFTIEAWVYFNHASQPSNNYEYAISLGTGGTSNHVSMSRFASDNRFYSYANGVVLYGPALSGQEWQHLVTVWDSSAPYLTLYVNGENQSVDQPAAAINTDGFGWIGQWQGGNWELNGSVDEVAIYNRTLTATEVLGNYQRGASKFNVSVRSCDDAACSGENWADINDTSPQQLSIDNNSYFQYKFNMENVGNYSPKLHNVSINYDIIPSLNHFYIRTYNENDLPRSNFANKSLARIKINGTYTTTPTITILDSEGTTIANEIEMVNESNIFTYNYTLNASNGWYDVTINSQEWKKAFYQAELWQGNYTDEDGNPFVFRREFNVTEPGINQRFFEPLEMKINFTYQPDNTSIRLVSHNGTDYIEIPSQIYNINQSSGDLYSADLVFSLTINKSETRNYFILSSKSSTRKNYTTDLVYSNTSEIYTIGNSYLTTFFNKSTGGLMQDVFNAIGTNNTLKGLDPMDYDPSFYIGVLELAARSDTTIQANTTGGPVMYALNISGNAGDSSSKPYNVNCKIYSKSQYVLCEKNQTTTATEYWKNFYLNGLFLKDDTFTEVAYKNSTGNITNATLSTVSNIDSNLDWIAFYDTSLGNAVSELFLNKSFSKTNNPSISINDEAGYDYYRHQIIDSTSTQVDTNDMFYTKTARLIYNGLQTYNYVNETYYNLQNPPTIVQFAEETSDSTNPSYSNLGNSSSNDISNATVYSYWSDDSFLDYADINITGPGTSGANTLVYSNGTYTIRNQSTLVNESWVNVTINSSELNAGTYETNITTYDISGKSNSTTINFTLTDSTASLVSNATNYPTSEDDVDPNSTIQFNSSIIEYSTVDTILLYYKPSAQGTWNTSVMSNIAQTNYNYTYNGNFTPTQESVYSYFVFANDTDGNQANSSVLSLNISFDTTWHIVSNLTASSGVFDKNVSLGNLTINNTGDYNLSFKVTAGVLGSRVYANETLTNTEPQFLVQNGSIIKLNINATTRPSGQTEGTDTITLTLANSSAYPTSNTTTVDIITIAGGPFLYATLISDNTTVDPGDSSIEITAKVENLGNETATNTNVTFTLPTDWITQYGLSSELGTINVGSFETYSILYDVPSDAAAGTYSIQADSNCSENKTGQKIFTITVASQEEETETGSGTGGGGGGGGGGGAGLDEEESSRLFQSTEIFEITRGEGAEFTYILSNPYDDATLEKINLELDGFTKDYIHFFPDHIRKLRINDSQNITVRITAPGYFTRGEYELKFTITGDVVKVDGSEIIPLTYDKKILLYLREVSREDASNYKDLAESYLEEMQQANFHTEEIEILVASLLDNYNQSLFKEVKELYDQIKTIHNNAIESFEGIQSIKEQIELAEKKGIDVTESQRLYKLAQTAFERGDYTNSIERVNECILTLAIETGGQYAREIMYSLKSNKKETAASAAGFIFFVIGTSMFTRSRMLKRKLRKLNEEQSLLVDLMKAIQIEVFQKTKMSMKEYGDAMTQYEERLNKVIEEKIMFENKKENLYKFKSKSRKLKEERDKLMARMSQAQHDYITKGKFETRVYENMLKSYSTRLSEVEEQIAVMDIKKVKK